MLFSIFSLWGSVRCVQFSSSEQPLYYYIRSWYCRYKVVFSGYLDFWKNTEKKKKKPYRLPTHYWNCKIRAGGVDTYVILFWSCSFQDSLNFSPLTKIQGWIPVLLSQQQKTNKQKKKKKTLLRCFHVKIRDVLLIVCYKCSVI